jgi:Short-chain alcohol dehydrogenase of unknown specificity
MTVKNKVVVITGASSGIGEASAKLLAQNGAKVVLGARREERLKKIVEDIKNAGGQATYKATDVTDADEVKALVELAKSEFGGLDVIFNNAGIMPSSPISALHTKEWNDMIDINIKGVLNGVAAVMPDSYLKNMVKSSLPHQLQVLRVLLVPECMEQLNSLFVI